MAANINVTADLQRLHDLLKMEYEHEKKEYADRSKLTDVAAKVRRGVCWFPVSAGRAFFNSINQFVVEIFRSGDELESTELEYGKPVTFFAQSGFDNPRFVGVNGLISYVDGNRMVVILQNESDVAVLQTAENLGVQLYFDESSYQLMFSALLQTVNAKDGRLAQLRDILLGSVAPQFRHNSPVAFPWLNPSQEAAVNNVINAKDVSIVHGPPGTGKTTTLVEAICETLKRENQVLVCAQSNMAVDWISEQLQDRGVPVLRIGNPTRVTDKMLGATYERQFENHPSYHELWSVRQSIRQLYSEKKARGSRAVQDKIARLRDRANALEIGIRQDLFDGSRVIASTLVGAANRLLDGVRFNSLFIDEAAQALEPACWIAIARSNRVILAGDHCQLPPTIKCVQAERLGLGVTLMEKIAKRKPQCVNLLDTQYRMCQEIVMFPSHWFYGDRLKTSDLVKHRNILQYDLPLVWHDTSNMDFGEEFSADTAGRSNSGEAEYIMNLLVQYADKIGHKRIVDENIDFGIISPYKQQVYKLRRMLKSKRELKLVKSHMTVNTIDGFQGQERDVIIISLVRANADGNIGFLSELRRMNVAITRSRMKLIIVGDASTLVHHKFYAELYAHVQKHGQVVVANS